jgi:hypothetical protein
MSLPNGNGIQPPELRMGMQISYTRKPLLGRLRSNIVLAAVNALLKGKIVRNALKDEILIAQNGGLLITLQGAGGGAGPELQVNDVDTAIQTLLNLKQGAGITITDNGDGSVTFTSAAAAKRFTLVSLASDYLVGSPVGGGPNVNIAKARTHRTSITSIVVDGITISLVYSDDNNRTANDGTNIQLEVSYPRYRVSDEIIAMQMINNTGVVVAGIDLPWLEINTRVWARKKTQ